MQMLLTVMMLMTLVASGSVLFRCSLDIVPPLTRVVLSRQTYH